MGVVAFKLFGPLGDAAYGRIAKQVNIPGFRKGKVPARIIEQRFGRGAVLEEAVNDALPKAYEEAVREHKVIPVGQPTVDVTAIEDGKHLAFTDKDGVVYVLGAADKKLAMMVSANSATCVPADPSVAGRSALKTRW